uniref:Uncharacterized protein n=1 Tax=Arundo donax TaxID=35708 RepID=A0A0A9FJ02_ARUDO
MIFVTNVCLQQKDDLLHREELLVPPV